MSAYSQKVVVLCWDAPKDSDRNARRIAEHLGADVDFVSSSLACSRPASTEDMIPHCACLIVHVDTLVNMLDQLRGGIAELRCMLSAAGDLFVYGFGENEHHDGVLQGLSGGVLLTTESLDRDATKFFVSEEYPNWSHQLTGLSVGRTDPGGTRCFVENPEARASAVVVRAGKKPFFLFTGTSTPRVFFLACEKMADLDEKVGFGAQLTSWFSQIIPIMMFLRGTLGDQLWHNDCHRACFIVDDPLLKRRYGFLEYAKLLQVMERLHFSACVAFIPWNFRRSTRKVAHLFSDPQSSLSLCVHGCDHTSAEFASTDFALMRDKARLALQRMTAHSRIAEAPFDDVMVFPQGLFSEEALKALAACGYLAAVNTEVCPSNNPETLTLQDLLQVAITRLGEFPLFSRHYPNDAAEFAVGLFIGKPALIVEHHDYFRSGYEELGAFVNEINKLAPRIEWTSLANICSQACLTKVSSSGEIHVRFYTSRFLITNRGVQSETYVLFRRLSAGKELPDVAVNGRPCAAEQIGGDLKIVLSLDPGQSAKVTILSDLTTAAQINSWRPTATYNAKVFLRRMLSEFRDNYVQTNRTLNGLFSNVGKLRSRMFQTRRVPPLELESENLAGSRVND